MKTFLFGLFMTGLLLSQFNQGNGETAPIEEPKVIATFDKISNGFIIKKAILNKRFADGSKIERFKIQKGKKGYFLVRQGIDGKQRFRSEAFRLKAIDKQGLKLLVIDWKIKWYTVCTSMDCWCHKIGDSCECADGGSCFFGTVPLDGDIEIVVLG